MFTNNYINFKHGQFTATNGSNSISMITHTGASASVPVASLAIVDVGAFFDRVRCETLGTNSGIFLGTGTTPPQKDDYTLEAVITTGLSVTNSNRLFVDEGGGKYSYSAQAVVKNTSGADITITEIGYFGVVSSKAYLFERRVLSNPITIKAGASKLVTNKITFNQSQ